MTPLAAALGSCSAMALSSRMVPEGLPAPHPGWSDGITKLNVIGPQKRSLPPPIMAGSFREALLQTLRGTGLLGQEQRTAHSGRELHVEILSQDRQGTFKRTSLTLLVSYTLVTSSSTEIPPKTYKIRTSAEIDDWKIDACSRLRRLQEQLSRENIAQAYQRIFLNPP